MRTPTYMILLAAPLALAACDAADDSTGTMMSDEMANSDSMPMSGEMPMAEETGGEQSASAEGKVTDIDPGAGTVTIEHGPVESIGWPAMTMTFRTKSAAQMRGLETGDRVRFTFTQQDAGPRIESITRAGQ